MAAGDILLDSSGNIVLDDDGNIMLDDGSGSGCCCGCITFCADDSTTTTSIPIVIAGVTLCTVCIVLPVGISLPYLSMKIVPGPGVDINGSYVMTQRVAQPCIFEILPFAVNSGDWTIEYYTDAACTILGTTIDASNIVRIAAVKISATDLRVRAHVDFEGADGNIHAANFFIAHYTTTSQRCNETLTVGNVYTACSTVADYTPQDPTGADDFTGYTIIGTGGTATIN